MNDIQWLLTGLMIGIFAGMGWGYASALRLAKKDENNGR
jgi:hypothetical protein